MLGLLSGGLSLLGSGLSALGQRSANKENRRIAEMQNRLNYQMFQEQNSFNERMWHQQNEYNTALAQRQRLEQAGINPAMALGQIQPGQASSLMSATPQGAAGATMQNALAPLGDGISNAVNSGINSYIQTQQLKNQTALAQAEIAKKKAEVAGIDVDNKFKAREKEKSLDQLQTSIDKMNAEKNRIEQLTPEEVNKIRSDIDYSKSQKALNEVEHSLRDYNLKHLKPLEKRQLLLGLSQAKAMIQNLAMQGVVLGKQAEYLVAQKLESQARAAGIRLNNDAMPELLGIQIRQAYADVGVTEANQRYIAEKAENAQYDVAFQTWDRLLNTVNSVGNLFKLGSSEMVTHSETVSEYDADGAHKGTTERTSRRSTGRR